MGYFLMERIFRSTPNGVLTAHTEWLPGVQLRHQYHLCSTYRGLWLSGCCGSVAEHWRLKPEVSWVRLPATAGFFTFLYFRLITSKFTQIFVEEHAHAAPRQHFNQLPPKTQIPRQNPIPSKHEGTDFTQQTLHNRLHTTDFTQQTLHTTDFTQQTFL